MIDSGNPPDPTCCKCGFNLPYYVGKLRVSTIFLYSDARFPSRMVVSLSQHHDHLDEVPAELLMNFMADIRCVSLVLRLGMGADRANVAVLGNLVSHVHAHVIPRKRAEEPNPSRSPWDDPRERQSLPDAERANVTDQLRVHFREQCPDLFS